MKEAVHPAPRTLLIALARGGSLRLPRKNIREVGGRSLIVRATETALAAARRLQNPTRVVVSTDDEEIARQAVCAGAEVPFRRPDRLATATASSADALWHAIHWLRDHGDTFSEVALIQPTAPLCRPDDVLRCLWALREDPRCSAVTVRRAVDANDRYLFGLRDQMLVSAEAARDNGELVALNGAVYAFAPDWLGRHDSLSHPGETRAILMPTLRSVDVDTHEDLQRARSLCASEGESDAAQPAEPVGAPTGI